MAMHGTRVAAMTIATALAGLIAAGPSQGAAKAKSYANCTALQQDYAHGVGRKGARDKTSGTPVTSFKVNDSLYAANDGGAGQRDLDRDNDGVACEKR
jgi:hypothetical protein